MLERADRIGGLLRYGIPEFKMEKRHLDRRLAQMRAEGTEFRTGAAVGDDVDVDILLGVNTLILNCPGPEITPVVSIIWSCWAEFTVGPRRFPLTTISDAETKSLPLTLSSAPCCT